jgi:alkylated DNA repair dioxygenase AlkB
MAVAMQASLFERAADAPECGALAGEIERRELSNGAWIDLRPAWLAGTEVLFERLLDGVRWRSERRQMYDRMVDVPRQVAHFHVGDRLPDPFLVEARESLSSHYRPVLPDGFATAGLALYRDGADSVAWHGDRIGRGATHDTLVAIVSLGDARPLLLRPRGGGRSLRLTLSSGDLLVMGGSCQRTWEHAVPKVRGAGPRMSVQFRPAGVW